MLRTKRKLKYEINASTTEEVASTAEKDLPYCL